MINHKLADVISQSFGATENTFPSKKSLFDLRSALRNAKAHHAGGGGLSEYFKRPAFQDGQRKLVGDRRGTPDSSLSAAVDGGAIVYTGYDAADTGYGIVGGTSEASPLFAGIVAHRSGRGQEARQPERDLVQARGPDQQQREPGLGTVNGAKFVPALAAEAGSGNTRART